MLISPMRRAMRFATVLMALPLLVGSSRAVAQSATEPLTVQRIFGTRDFSPQGAPYLAWLADGQSYLVVRRAAEGGADLLKVTLPAFDTTVLVPAAVLRDEQGRGIVPEQVHFSADGSKALLFHRSVPVWRENTRGVYHVLDIARGTITPLVPNAEARTPPPPGEFGSGVTDGRPGFLAAGMQSGAADPDLQMFAKFSPDGRQVGYVRGNNVWVMDLATGARRQLTTDGSDDIINGTTDWVHEEELGLQDAFRWSPDSRRIAFWRFDQRAVPAFPMVDEIRRYPLVSTLRYPKAGAPNSAVTLHVATVADGTLRRLDVGVDTGQYFARMEWVDADSLAIVRLVRKQDRMDLLLQSATSGTGRTILTETDSAYVDVEGEPVVWLANGRQFLLRTDRTGWRQWFLYDRSGRMLRQLTRDGADVVALLGVDERTGVLYASVAAPSARERQVYRIALNGRRYDRVTEVAGTHALSLSPTSRYGIHTHSTLGVPATVTLRELPSFRVVRTYTDNATLKSRLAATGVRAPEFFTVPMPDGTVLDAYRILPPSFDSTRAYPVLMHLYGGPAAPQVNDAWGGARYLWHQSLARDGYVVVIVDNRGAAWRGRAFRKITQFQLGLQESQDQIDAAKWLATRSWVDGSRIAMWGWSYGGYMTAMTLARGGNVFKAGIAVAPVTAWDYYDSIYTERFMWTPQGNPEGYAKTSVMSHVDNLTARLLLVHGTGDDNVHPQNSLVLTEALIKANKPFEMLLYPNRNHGISGGNTSVHLYESFTRFLKERL